MCSSKLDPLTRTGFILALNSTGILTLSVYNMWNCKFAFNFLFDIYYPSCRLIGELICSTHIILFYVDNQRHYIYKFWYGWKYPVTLQSLVFLDCERHNQKRLSYQSCSSWWHIILQWCSISVYFPLLSFLTHKIYFTHFLFLFAKLLMSGVWRSKIRT